MEANEEEVNLLNDIENEATNEAKEEVKATDISKSKPVGFLSGITSTLVSSMDRVNNYVGPTVKNIKTSAANIGYKVKETLKNSGKKTLKVFRKPLTSLKELGTIIFDEFTQKQLQDIKAEFLTATKTERSNQPQDVVFTQKYGTRPTIVLPKKHMVNVAAAGIKQTNTRYIAIQFTDIVAKGVTLGAGVVVGSSVVAGAAIAMPPLMCIPLGVCLATYLQFQREKNKELLYASELIFSMCQDMLPDLIRMYNFYTIINKGKEKPTVNEFILKTIKKVTDLQLYIISLCDPIVIEFMALSFGIIDTFDERYNFDDDKYIKIFGQQGFNYRCHLPDDERTIIGEDGAEMKKSDDDCDGNSSERSFASVKRAIIARLTMFHVKRQSTNFFASSEKYRQAIRDITIVGILFSQASARFSLDAIDHVSALQEATTKFADSDDKSSSNMLNDIASNESEKVEHKITQLNIYEINNETASTTDTSRSVVEGGRRRKRTRKYRR